MNQTSPHVCSERTLRFEVCTDSLDGVAAALAVGADRVELCARLAVGGVTPSARTIADAAALIAGRCALHVLVRPRAGDFVYDQDEVTLTLSEIAMALHYGADGIVIGALTAAHEIDQAAGRLWIDCARPAAITWHRAFDAAADLDRALDTMMTLGVDRVLTSGGAATATEGRHALARFVKAAGERLIILPAAGITAANAGLLIRCANATELHFSGRAAEPAGTSLTERLAATIQAGRAALIAS